MPAIVTVSARNQKISPKKARLVMDQIRTKNASKALDLLKFMDKKGAGMILDLLKSAAAAAKDKDYKIENLSISEAVCSEGRKLKRNHPNARGRVNVYAKRMSHFRMSLSEEKAQETKEKRIPKKDQRIEKEKNGSKS